MKTVLGIETNVGSLLYPFQQKGFKILGAYDSRNIVKPANWLRNFPGVPLFNSLELPDFDEEVDIIMSQPSCSKFSPLSMKRDYSDVACVDIVPIITRYRPKLFFIESKLGYIDEFPVVDGYKYQLEWIHNYGYGNPQYRRDRLWIMGIRDDVDWRFIPNEKAHENTTASVMADLPATDLPDIDHVHNFQPPFKNAQTGERFTAEEMLEMMKTQGRVTYIAKDGATKYRIGKKIIDPVRAPTITSSTGLFHWEKGKPLTVREMARVQGFPDEFTFQGIPESYKPGAVGKSMPFEFTNYLVDSIMGNGADEPSKMVPDPAKLSLLKLGNLNHLLK